MALVKVEDKKEVSTWNRKDKLSTQYKGDVKTPAIDYDKLRKLCEIKGLGDGNNTISTEQAHREFMDNIHTMFVPEPAKCGFPVHYENRSLKKLSSVDDTSALSLVSKAGSQETKSTSEVQNEDGNATSSHDIRDYLPLLHKHRTSETPQGQRVERIKLLRRLLRKLPFQRSAEENDQIYKAMKHFKGVASQVEGSVLKELCVVAQLDVWKEEESVTIFGNTGLHMILRGSVRPQTLPYLKQVGEEMVIRSPTPVLDDDQQNSISVLRVGDCFGTLERIEGREANSRVLTVMTNDTHCEFLKISNSDYKRVIQQIKQREETEKVNLLQSCETYKLWSKQPLTKIAGLLRWTSYPANTVIVSEGYQSPFAAIIKSGECHVLRSVEVLHTLSSGKQERRTKQVVVGKLQTHDSFGEVSVIEQEPMTCSIVTYSKVELAYLEPDDLEELDEVTLQLLLQSSAKTFGDLSQDDIHTEYVNQETKREWNEYKHQVVLETINKGGIRPGYGKWSK